MPGLPHTAIFTDNRSRKDAFFRDLLGGRLPPELSFLQGLSGGVFSTGQLAGFLEEEARHDTSGLLPSGERRLATFSSGERKKALLRHLLSRRPDFLVLDNPFDNLDRSFQRELRDEFKELSRQVILLQVLSRPGDLLPFIRQHAFLDGAGLTGFPKYSPPTPETGNQEPFEGTLPPPPYPAEELPEVLVEFRGVSLAFGENPVLQELSWSVRQGEFWELRGPNGSGKSSLIQMITGDSPKAYGQELYLFGRRKGSGESVWEVKERIGYVTPAMTDRFRGYHPAAHMLISGLTDSVGLYRQPTDSQRQLAMGWLRLLGLESRQDDLFNTLTEGEQRLLMCARAMIKHPPLLILDEPTAGLDEASARMVVGLVRKMASESQTAIVFVSHRDEPGLRPEWVLELEPGPQGSRGRVRRHSPG